VSRESWSAMAHAQFERDRERAETERPGYGPPDIDEHKKHPAEDMCVFCRSQWPCEEAGNE
jgi:hypothetical protein